MKTARPGLLAARALITAFGVTLLVFLVLRLVPGDPVDLMLGELAAPAMREQLREQLGLSEAPARQLLSYFGNLAQGDLGQSLTLHQPVTRLIAESFPFTAVLALATALFSNLVGIPLGAWMAFRARSEFSTVLFFGTVLLASVPVFWLGPLLVLTLALHWPWLPISSGEDLLKSLILPTLTMGLGFSAFLAQTSRAAVSEVLSSDFIRTAYAKGLSELQVLFRHAVPAAATPILTVSALQLGHLLAGAVITEMLFDWPGMGKLIYDAILRRDYPVVQGGALVVALTYVLINLLTDLLNARLSHGK